MALAATRGDMAARRAAVLASRQTPVPGTLPAEPTVPYEPVPVAPVGGLLQSAVGSPQQPLPPVPPPPPPPVLTPMPSGGTPIPADPRATTYENDSVIEALNAIIDQDSDYMQLARTSGLQVANKRGLLNSSIAAGTSQAAAIAAAAPLAQQEAGQRSSRNLARINAYFTKEQQAKDIDARERMLATQLRSEEERLGRQLTSQEMMQQRDIVSQQFMQTRQIEATKTITQMNIAAAEKNLNRQLTSAEMMQVKQISADQARLQMELTSREALTREGYTTELEKAQLQEAGATTRANLDAATRIQQTEMATLAANQQASLQYYLGQDQIYAQSLINIYNNKDLPAPERERAMQQFLALKNSGADLPAALFGLDLQWGTPAPAPTPTAPPPVGGTPPPAVPPPPTGTTTVPPPTGMSKLDAARAGLGGTGLA